VGALSALPLEGLGEPDDTVAQLHCADFIDPKSAGGGELGRADVCAEGLLRLWCGDADSVRAALRQDGAADASTLRIHGARCEAG